MGMFFMSHKLATVKFLPRRYRPDPAAMLGSQLLELTFWAVTRPKQGLVYSKEARKIKRQRDKYQFQ